MKKKISWINNQWESDQDLFISIRDRGLLIGDGIFETIQILEGQPKLLPNHLERWKKNASILGMAPPPNEKWLKSIIAEAIKRAHLSRSNAVLRLNWSRGNINTRGIEIPLEKNKEINHTFWLDIHESEPIFNIISTKISLKEQRNANSRLSQCKTFNYGQAIQARKEANDEGFDEALLLSTTGEMCCGAVGNIIVKRNKNFFTPRISSGCLPGIMRQKGIAQGLIQEIRLDSIPLKNDEWLLINSLSCRPISKINDNSLNVWQNPQEFWFQLIN